MNARAFAAWSAAGLTVVMTSPNPVYRGLVLLAALNVIIAAGRPGISRRPLAVSLLVAIALAAAFNAVLGHSGTHVLARLPDAIPVIGGPLTVESIVYGFGVGLGLAAAVLVVAPLSLCIEPDQLVAALPGALSRTGASLGAALNLVPAIARSVSAISEAQRLRGIPAGLRGARAIIIPATLTALEDSLQLAESMEARGYGSGPRSSYSEAVWRPFDVVVVVVSAAAAGGFVAAHALGAIPDWYPYPALTAPPVSLFATAACLLLILPALRWHSRISTG